MSTGDEQVWSATVDHLRALIDSGELPAGSRLPSERKLCEQLDVSRGSLRQALRVLASIGYVSIRPGSGTYVRDREGTDRELRTWFREHDQLVDRLFDLRMMVEPTLAERLAAEHTEPVLARLRSNVAEMAAAAAKGDMLRVIATDAEFHRVIAENAGNDDVAGLLRSVLSLVGEERRAALRLPGQIAKAVEEHGEILAAIEKSDGERARELTVSHLREAQSLVHRYAGESTSD
ncbi:MULTISPECIES: FadR/GntR family transcriptional regulator [Amycolatopsis]|uniref:GntR family transcriptional regulator, transcriptional repressor for pyruvate dehydrogenase complex n=2 Tax=Amycolatopsis TaxID=1813 RepID=A0A1I4CHJ1_9PSEU|nr:FCD domain-containing protein [Amycolatopsis sacchari]SFK79441.1 GntR family transcriptional regulator, transcriptional repressor for pyruvate dehydrogenase complex [Amycolatopsis sacchari]